MFFALTIATAFALDLDVQLTTPSGEVKSMTFHNVETSVPPTLQLQVHDVRVLVTLTVTPKDDTFAIHAELAEVDTKGRTKRISAPTVVVHTNEPGTVSQGSRISVAGTNPVEYRTESWALSFLIHS